MPSDELVFVWKSDLRHALDLQVEMRVRLGKKWCQENINERENEAYHNLRTAAQGGQADGK